LKARQQKIGPPAFAESQRAEILEMLKAAGPAGVSKAELIFTKHWTQCAARIFELERMGYKIAHVQRSGDRLVRFILESEPLELKPPNSSDSYERTTGKARTTGDPGSVPDLPLFSGVDR
jgi:hypothetical protein